MRGESIKSSAYRSIGTVSQSKRKLSYEDSAKNDEQSTYLNAES